MKQLNDKVKKLNEDPEILDVIIENEDEIIANSMFEKGLSKGINQGAEQRNIEIAKKMLKKGMSISEISEITGLSKNEINSFKK